MLRRHGDRYPSQMRRTYRLFERELRDILLPDSIDKEKRTPLHYDALRGYDEAVKHVMTYLGGRNDLNLPHGSMGWTPIGEAIRRDHRSRSRYLNEEGADLSIKVDDASKQGRSKWSLLHLAAQSALHYECTILSELLESGIQVDGVEPEGLDAPETPLALAIANNQFDVATFLQECGADIDAKSKVTLRGHLKLKYRTTILGRIIPANMRHSKWKLYHLLYQPKEVRGFEQADFAVVPDEGLTAIHASVMGMSMLETPTERDVETMRNILEIVVEKFDEPVQINRQDTVQGQTVLYVAARHADLYATKLLVEEVEADVDIRDCHGRRPIDITRSELEQLPLDQRVSDKGQRCGDIIKTSGSLGSLSTIVKGPPKSTSGKRGLFVLCRDGVLA